MSQNGLSIETAAGVTARDMIMQHMAAFALVIRRDRLAGRGTIAAYVDGLAGAIALVVAGQHGSREDVVSATIHSLREAIDRDLMHLGANSVK